jgi:hypothetical protein
VFKKDFENTENKKRKNSFKFNRKDKLDLHTIEVKGILKPVIEMAREDKNVSFILETSYFDYPLKISPKLINFAKENVWSEIKVRGVIEDSNMTIRVKSFYDFDINNRFTVYIDDQKIDKEAITAGLDVLKIDTEQMA